MVKRHIKKPFNALMNVTSHQEKLPSSSSFGRDDVLSFTVHILVRRRHLIVLLAKLSRIQYMEHRKRILSVVKTFNGFNNSFFLTKKKNIDERCLPSPPERELAMEQCLRVISNQRRLRHLFEKLDNDTLKLAILNIINAIHFIDKKYADEIEAIASHEVQLFHDLEEALLSV